MDIRMKTETGKKWLSKDINVVIGEVNGCFSNKNSKKDFIDDAIQMKDFLLSIGEAAETSQVLQNGFNKIIKTAGDDGDAIIFSNDMNPSNGIDKQDAIIDVDSFEFDEYLCRKYINTKNNAKSRGIEFTLSLNDMRLILRAKKCKYSGVAFDNYKNKRSLDRVDSTKGYVKGNVVACSQYVNHLKNCLIEHSETKEVLGGQGIKNMLESFLRINKDLT